MRETRTEKNYISKDAFRSWVNAMCKQFDNAEDAMVHKTENTVYVYLRSKVGIAKKSPNDKFDASIGVAYAWARCTGQPVYYEKEGYIPKAGEWVYVSTINSSIRFLVKYMCEGADNYCFKWGNGELSLIKKTDITNIALAD